MGGDEGRRGHSRDTLHDDSPRAPEVTSSQEIVAFEEHDEDLDAFVDLRPGSKLGARYLIESVLGKGGAGVVFEASHLVIGKHVALKCLYPQLSASRVAVERFLREAKIAATVEHPNVIQVFDGGRADDVLFIAMERLHGESLGDRLERGPMNVRDAVETFLAIMEGVAAVHAHGVVHRDLKPDNIFLARAKDGRVIPKVLDFGISKLKEPGRELTSLGTVMGTPYYMAPEQIKSTRDVDVRADVYSLGVMLYEALLGDVPYADESVINVFRRTQQGHDGVFERLCEDVPEPIARVVDKAMASDRAARFASVSEMHAALAAALGSDTDPSTLRPHEVSPLLDDGGTLVSIAAGPAMDEGDTPPKGFASLSVSERATLPPAPALRVVERAPPWMWWALAAAAAITAFSMLTALLALVF